MRERLSAYAYPRRVEFVKELPKTLTGKIRRIELRERETAWLAGWLRATLLFRRIAHSTAGALGPQPGNAAREPMASPGGWECQAAQATTRSSGT